jgi:hypothetical protein
VTVLNGARSGTIVQLAYVVDDLRSAAAKWAAALGAGPFFVYSHLPMTVRHNGHPAVMDHSAAFGQWGEVMVELIEYHQIEPPELATELSHRDGVHHVAWFAPSLEAEQLRLESNGWPEVLNMEADGGIRMAFHRASTLGHLVEVYEACPALLALYRKVAEAAHGWDGSEPVRERRFSSERR